MWSRRVELNVTGFIHHACHYAEGLARFRSRIPVLPETAAGLKAVAQDRLRWLDGMFRAGPCLCGAHFSAADIWLHAWLGFDASVHQPFDRALPRIGPLFDHMATRPSADRSHQLLSAAAPPLPGAESCSDQASGIR